MGLKEKTEGRYNFCDAFCVEFYWIFLPERDNYAAGLECTKDEFGSFRHFLLERHAKGCERQMILGHLILLGAQGNDTRRQTAHKN